ncbi:MAG: monooxygenase [Planctomycetaceae bacterium]|nr:monooxygenase [Planctomycetaceae bacterium]
MNTSEYDVIVVGGGAAGLGVGVALRHAGIDNFIVVERQIIGASFALWPRETRFITPSFPTNSIGMLDLNSIAIGVSPAYSLEVEHPTGAEYALHLQAVAAFFEIPVQEETEVKRITKIGNDFVVDTNESTLRAKHVIWAGGEFQFPKTEGFEGIELCRHTATISSYQGLEGEDFIIVGGYESGVDAAYHLASRGKRVRLFDKGCPWKEETSDPSIALSTYSKERMREERFQQNVELFSDTLIKSVTKVDDLYEVTTQSGQLFQSPVAPLMAGGFDSSHKLVTDLFDRRDDGFPLLNEDDESTIVSGIYLCGPTVRHDNHVFCFIYKFRQRFAVVAKAIATSLGLTAEELEAYREWGMYLDDLSCCGEECATC